MNGTLKSIPNNILLQFRTHRPQKCFLGIQQSPMPKKAGVQEPGTEFLPPTENMDLSCAFQILLETHKVTRASHYYNTDDSDWIVSFFLSPKNGAGNIKEQFLGNILHKAVTESFWRTRGFLNHGAGGPTMAINCHMPNHRFESDGSLREVWPNGNKHKKPGDVKVPIRPRATLTLENGCIRAIPVEG